MNKNMIIILTSIIIFIFISAGVYFILNFNPGSLRYVMGKLDSYLQTEYKYVSTYRASEPNIEGIKPVTYLFEDINGIGFDVVTFPPFGDYDSSQPGYPQCDYLTAYHISKKEVLERALQCEVPITWVNSGTYAGFDILVSSYDDLELIAPVIEEALNIFDPLITEKYSEAETDKFEFYIPELGVWTADRKYIISVFNFRLIKGQMQWTRAEILDKLQRDYKEKVVE